MSEHSSFEGLLFFLVAAVVAVPLFKKFRLGAILGYLFAGLVMGPSGLHLIVESQNVLGFAEIGVVLLLFVIGLELNPEKLWNMRATVTLLGGGQIVITAFVIGSCALLFGATHGAALLIGLALALSSTAFALQLLAEKGIIASVNGRRAFAILLMQDLAIIPILLLAQFLSAVPAQHATAWWFSVLLVVVLLLIGRYALDPMLKIVARYGNRESMTAMALLIVVGAAYLMQAANLSMGMGAFVAGVMLANSSFRHQLESDIEPFKGLSLGLFFMAIGMTLNVQLLLANPAAVFGYAVGMMLVKTVLITGLLALLKVHWRTGLPLGLMLSQGGEFAFVVMNQSLANNIVSTTTAETVNLVVSLSMALTSPVVAAVGLLLRQSKNAGAGNYQVRQLDDPEVLILGFGRFGQTTGRILAAKHIPFSALDRDAEHVQFVKRFGNQIHFGDATRLDLLEAAGIHSARVVVVALNEVEATEKCVVLIRQHCPRVKIIARAHNRVTNLKLVAAGADVVIREMFSGSLTAATETLMALGYGTGEAIKIGETFRVHDEQLIANALSHEDDLEKLIELGVQGRKELERLFNEDQAL